VVVGNRECLAQRQRTAQQAAAASGKHGTHVSNDDEGEGPRAEVPAQEERDGGVRDSERETRIPKC
jgi:hypothetical protein